MSLLQLDNVHTYYGHIHALKGISLVVEEGEVVTLIGANGAGKSTTLRTISGLLHAREGSIHLNGKDITRMPPHEIVVIGVGQVPEGRGIFPRLTVRENLEMGAYTVNNTAEISRRMEEVFSLFPRLLERVDQKGGTLSGGEQQMLAIGRGLMAEPRLLILDEPSLGLSPLLVEELFGLIKAINAEGIALLLVEQNVVQSLEVARRAYILDNGLFVLQGDAAVIRNDPELKRAYLGM
jgi:branched-chain amino acid transport system ATP-binding protein